MGISYETVDYLARLVSPDKLPDPNLKDNDGKNFSIASVSIRNNLNELKTAHFSIKNKILTWWRNKCS